MMERIRMWWDDIRLRRELAMRRMKDWAVPLPSNAPKEQGR